MNENKTWVTLEHPIKVGAESVDRIGLRRAKVKDLRLMMQHDSEGSDFDQMLGMVSRLSKQPIAVLDLMDATDLKKVGEVVEVFLGRSRQIGKD